MEDLTKPLIRVDLYTSMNRSRLSAGSIKIRDTARAHFLVEIELPTEHCLLPLYYNSPTFRAFLPTAQYFTFFLIVNKL